jgi:hypothetical protein
MPAPSAIGHTAGRGEFAHGSITTDPLMAPAERERVEVYNEAYRDAETRGFKPASVIRFCPWTLTLDGAAHQSKRLIGVPSERDLWDAHFPRLVLANGLSIPITHHVITAPCITAGTKFRGTGKTDSYAELKASVDLPMGLGCDMVRQQNMFNTQGGIFCYEGAELPQNADGKWFHPELKAAVGWNEYMPLPQAAEQAFARMLVHMKDIASTATDAHRSGDKVALREVKGNRKNQCIHYLLNVGALTDPPAWFLEHGGAATGSKHSKCPICPRRIEAGTVRCQCGYIVDPFAGYGTAYDEEMPGGLMTARRMTKAQLQELGLYPRIKPLEEHVADLNRAAAKENTKEKKEKEKDGNK